MNAIFRGVAIIALLALSECKDDVSPQLPAETTSGANTFGCKIDGQIFVPRASRNDSGFESGYRVLAKDYYLFSLSADDFSGYPGKYVIISTDSFRLETGRVFDLKKGGVQIFVLNGDGGDYSFRAHDSGQLTITCFDSVRHILSGRFDFTASADVTGGVLPGKQVHVTDGRFDISVF
ncbi:hypothetical protein [Hymenobacter baengnokdamensis]|uniref:hypothetical protein n=1 Tax=Hymenobacter baengnokdamensis TaxID=2615203 RepID=UPI0012479735|nr:hypothetical protein [Hymenobacter baengnokdamensis]